MTAGEARAVARIAARTARRNWLRTVLIVALIAVPVAAAQIAAGMMKAGRVAPEEWADSAFGQADAEIVVGWTDERVAQWVEERLAAFAPDAETTEYRWSYARLGDEGERFTEVTDLDLSDPLTVGKLALTAGRLPAHGSEAAISESDATLLDVAIGDSITVAHDGRPTATYDVVGTVRDPLYLDRSAVVIAPAAMDAVLSQPSTPLGIPQDHRWLVAGVDPSSLGEQLVAAWEADRLEFYPEPAVSPRPAALAALPDDLYVQLDAGQVAELENLALAGTSGEEVVNAGYSMLDTTNTVPVPFVAYSSRADYAYYEPLSDQLVRQPIVIGTLVAGLLLAEVALVAGAAYATGARRRLRELGLMSANGATTAHLRWSVVGEGVVAGVLGAAAGSLIALAAFTLGRDLMQRFIDRLIVGVPLSPLEFLGPAMAGALAATVAAWLPARAVATVPALTALQGRVPLAQPRRWVVPLGIGLAGLGAFLVTVARTASGGAATIQVTAGVIITIGGFALLSGPMVALVGRHADRFPAVIRLVLRDSARQRTRAAAAMAATMVILTGPVVLGTAVRSEQQRQLIWGLPSPATHALVFQRGGYDWAAEVDEEAVSAVAAKLPDARRATLHVFVDPAGVVGTTVTAIPHSDAEERAALGVALGTSELISALAVPELGTALELGPVLLGVDRGVREVTISGRSFTAQEFPVPVMRFMMPRLLVSEHFAAAERLAPAGVGTLLVANEPLTEKQRLSLGNSPEATVLTEWPEAFTMEQLLWLGLGATLLVVLLIVGLVTALAATESDHDLRTMVAIGAPPRMRRRFLGTQTTYYTLFAALLATPLALLLLRVATSGGNWVDQGAFGSMAGGALVVPWDVIVLVILALPAAVGVVTAIAVRSSPTVPPRRGG
jgi:putative ABC transport system permease protein